jgi:hypothetical protein
MVFNGTFNNISDISWRGQFYRWRKQGYPENTTDLSLPNFTIIVTNKIIKYTFKILPHHTRIKGPRWLSSYGTWIYNYLCNQCLSPLNVWGRIPLMAMCTRYSIIVVNPSTIRWQPPRPLNPCMMWKYFEGILYNLIRNYYSRLFGGRFSLLR